MKISHERTDQFIEKISDITATIKKTYERMKNCETEEELEKLKNFLEIAIELENKIYQDVDPEILNAELFLNRLKYLINQSELEYKDDIFTRISAYVCAKDKLNPFPSQIPNPIDNTLENSELIFTQASLDFYKAIIINVNEEISKEKDKDKDIVKILLSHKYDIYYGFKDLKQIIKSEDTIEINGRKKCQNFNHNPNLINKCYADCACQIIDNSILNILLGNESIIAQVNLKSALTILNKVEIFRIAKYYNENVSHNPEVAELVNGNPNNEIVISIFREFLEKGNNDSKSDNQMIKTMEQKPNNLNNE